jgi:hypothetical protein
MMKLFRLFGRKPKNAVRLRLTQNTRTGVQTLSATPAQTGGYTSVEIAEGLRLTHRDTVISKRDRSAQDQAKIDAMQAFVGVALANEDIDSVFLAMFNEAQTLGYRLVAPPENLLHKLNDVR